MATLDPRLIEQGKKVVEAIAAWHARYADLFEWPDDIGAGRLWTSEGSDKLLTGPAVTAEHCYPFLFTELFPQVPAQQVHEEAVAGYLYAQHLLFQDRLLDGQVGERDPSRCRLLLLADLLHEASLGMFRSLFAIGSPFWHHLDSYHRQFSRAVFLEWAKHTGRISPYPSDERATIATGKCALYKSAMAAMATLAQDQDTLAPLTASADWVAQGMQLYDDLTDWRKDYQREQYSYLLTRVIVEEGFEKDVVSGARPDVQAIGRAVYYSGLAEATLDEADQAYMQAMNSVAELNCPQWVKHIQLLQANCRRLKADLGDIVRRTLAQCEKSQ